MKRLLLTILSINVIGIQAMEQPEPFEEKELAIQVPTLRELAAKKLLEQVSPGSKTFWELRAPAQKELLLAKKNWSLKEMMSFLQQYPEANPLLQALDIKKTTEEFLRDIVSDIINKLPKAFFGAFEACTIELSTFLNWIETLGPRMREDIKEVFTKEIVRKIQIFTTPPQIYIEVTGKQKYIIPIGFKKENFQLKRTIKIRNEIEYLVPLYIEYVVQENILPDIIKFIRTRLSSSIDRKKLNKQTKVLQKFLNKSLDSELQSYARTLLTIMKLIKDGSYKTISGSLRRWNFNQ